MFKELRTLYILFLSYTIFYFWKKFRLFYMLCSYSICSVYKNNGNIQNAINIITYVWKFWKVEYTMQAASNNNLYENSEGDSGT